MCTVRPKSAHTLLSHWLRLNIEASVPPTMLPAISATPVNGASRNNACRCRHHRGLDKKNWVVSVVVGGQTLATASTANSQQPAPHPLSPPPPACHTSARKYTKAKYTYTNTPDRYFRPRDMLPYFQKEQHGPWRTRHTRRTTNHAVLRRQIVFVNTFSGSYVPIVLVHKRRGSTPRGGRDVHY